MGDVLSALLPKISANWHRPTSVVAALFLTGVSLVAVLPSWDEPPYLSWGVLAVAELAVLSYWISYRHIKPVPVGRIGVVLAISAEKAAHREQVVNDFVPMFRAAFDKVDGGSIFEVVVLPDWMARMIHNSASAGDVIRKVNGTLLLFGTAKLRSQKGKEWHVLSLQQVVQHRPLALDASAEFSKEMSSVFPGRLRFERESELEGMEIAAGLAVVSAQYFVAVAALIANELDLSEQLLLQLADDSRVAKLQKDKTPRVRRHAFTLNKLVSQRLADIAGIRGRNAFLDWQATRDQSAMERLHANAKEYLKYSGDKYQYAIQRALWLFVTRRDVKSAIAQIERVMSKDDAAWRFSLAFLHAYQGNLDASLDLYRKLLKRDDAGNHFLDVENFIAWVIEEEPEKCWLYFCLGMINLLGKEDDVQARNDFQRYAECPDLQSHQSTSKRVTQFVSRQLNGE